MAEQQQDDEQDQSRPKAPADQLFLDGQQRLDGIVDFRFEIFLRHFLDFPQPTSGGLTPAKNSQDMTSPTQMTKPNSETK